MASKCKILIFGATGYLGKYMVKASVSFGCPTYIYTRPITISTNAAKLELIREFELMGVTIFQGELDEHDKLVSVLRKVDIVISTLAVPQYLEQLKIIDAIKNAGNIKRFAPSEYGHEAGRISALPPFQALLENKMKIRRATEAAGIPYTFVSASSLAVYTIDLLLHPYEQREQVIVYGSGRAQVVFNFEEDVAAYTIKAVNDPKAHNRLIICRPPGNIASQLELISMWEKKTGSKLEKVHIPEEEILRQSEVLPYPDNIPISIIYSNFVKGDQMRFELRENDMEASNLYPDYEYTSVHRLINRFFDLPKPKRATLA